MDFGSILGGLTGGGGGGGGQSSSAQSAANSSIYFARGRDAATPTSSTVWIVAGGIAFVALLFFVWRLK